MKVLLVSLYKPPPLNEKDFLFHLNNGYNLFCCTYETRKLNDLCEMNKLEHLILKSTCFTSLFPSTIDHLILTNHKQSFMKWDVYETAIWAYQKKISSVLGKTFGKGKPETFSYCCFKRHDHTSFNKTPQNKTSEPDSPFQEFAETFQLALDVFAPYKQNKVRYNDKEFLDIQATIECRFTLKLVLETIITYSHNNDPFHDKNPFKRNHGMVEIA